MLNFELIHKRFKNKKGSFPEYNEGRNKAVRIYMIHTEYLFLLFGSEASV